MADVTPLRVNQALLDANGDYDSAAALLAISVDHLHSVVSENEALRRRWKDKTPKIPPASSIIARQEDVALVEAMQREEESLRNGAKTLNLSKRASDLAVACQKFHRQNFTQIMGVTSGGITFAFLETLAEIERLNKLISEADTLPDEKRVALESIWRDDRAKLLDFIYKASVKVDNGILIQAKVQKMLGDGGKGGPSKSKPGFAPIKRVNHDQTPESDE